VPQFLRKHPIPVQPTKLPATALLNANNIGAAHLACLDFARHLTTPTPERYFSTEWPERL
jgi:hypothetical protein